MAHCVDDHNQPLTCASPTALLLFNKAVIEYVGWYGDTFSSCGESVKEDPSFIMGLCFLGTLDAFGM